MKYDNARENKETAWDVFAHLCIEGYFLEDLVDGFKIRFN
jgi:hypothetical protein